MLIDCCLHPSLVSACNLADDYARDTCILARDKAAISPCIFPIEFLVDLVFPPLVSCAMMYSQVFPFE